MRYPIAAAVLLAAAPALGQQVSHPVTGPNVATTSELAVWHNTTGQVLRDGRGTQIVHSDAQTTPIIDTGSALAAYSNVADGITANQIWAWVNFPIGHPLTGAPYDTLRGVLTPPVGTDRIHGAIGSYVLSSATAASGSINYIGEAIVDADGGSIWGLNFLFSDNRGQVITSNGSPACVPPNTVGCGPRSFINEIDFNFTSPYSQGIGLTFGGNSLAQPGSAGGFGAHAIALGTLDGYPGSGNVAKWSSFLGSAAGSTLTFAGINSTVPSGTYTASFDGTTMTVSAVNTGFVGADMTSGAIINAAGVTAGTRVKSQVTPLIGGESQGGPGRYTISAAHTLASRLVTSGADSQALYFHSYDTTGALKSTIIQGSYGGHFLINAPVSTTLMANLATVGVFKAGVAVIGSPAGAGVHINSAAALPPLVTACGTSPSIVGTDTAGTVTMGTTAVGCNLEFRTYYTSLPACTVTWRGNPLAVQNYNVTTTAIVLTQTSTSGNKVDYHCTGMGDT